MAVVIALPLVGAAQQPVREVVVSAAATPVPFATVTRALTVITREQLAPLIW